MKKIAISVLAFFIMIMVVFMGTSTGSGNVANKKGKANVPEIVRRWEPFVGQYATRYGVSEHTELFLAIIMVESGGDDAKTPDIMGASRHVDYTIENPHESLEVGIRYFSECMKYAKDNQIIEVKFVVQAYNFGIEFLEYIKNKDVKNWKEEYAKEYYDQHNQQGIVDYVNQVYKYYSVDVPSSNSGMIVPTRIHLMNERYGWTYDPERFHSGIDLQCSTGADALAAKDGVVKEASWGYNGGFGNVIILDHGDGVDTLYAHLSNIHVSNGQTVTQGQVIGACGNTGFSFGAHLHFEVRVNGQRLDPRPFLPPLEESSLVSP